MTSILGTEIIADFEQSGGKTYSNDDWNALQFSASVEEVETVKRLVTSDELDCNYQTKSKVIPQVTALHIAARKGNMDVIKLLVPRVDVNAVDQWGFSALHYAVVARHKDVVCYLLSNGASAIIESKSGVTAHDLAKELQYEDIVDALISKINLEKDPLMPKFKAWLNHLGAGEFLPRFVEAGYDLKFVYERGLNESDMENLQIPKAKFGLYRKIVEKYEIDQFYSVDEEGDEDSGDGDDETEESGDDESGDSEEEDE